MIVALFLGGFITIGGEWFAMWQSKDWNGIGAALRMVTIAGFALILVHLNPRRATP
jgi:predicted small integral membrane protein